MIAVVTSVVALAFAGWVAVHAMDHIERLAMIRRGIVPPPDGPLVVRVMPLPNAVAMRYLRLAIVLGCTAFVIMLCLAYLAYPLP